MSEEQTEGSRVGSNALLCAAPTIEAAYAMGAKGAPAVEDERLAFEAWMRGHCWGLCATWRGDGYSSDAENDGNCIDPRAMMTRRLWAAWRDRAALAHNDSFSGPTGAQRPEGRAGSDS